MSLTKRIVGLVALALVPALAIQGYNEHALGTVRGEAIRTARSIAADLGQFGRGVRPGVRLWTRPERQPLKLVEPGCSF